MSTQPQAIIDSLSDDGKGLACLNHKKILIRHGLPGEQVAFKYIRNNKRYAEGYVTDVLANPHAQRIQPHCKHFSDCGGCQLQHVEPAYQLHMKEQALLKLLDHAQVQVGHVAKALTDLWWHYRTKARLSIKYIRAQQQLAVGFHSQRHRHSVVNLEECPILPPSIWVLVQALKDWIAHSDHRTTIPQLELACSERDHAVILRHLSPLSDQAINELKCLGETHHVAIYLQPEGMDSIHSIMSQPTILRYTHPKHRIEIDFQPQDFTQVNLAMNRAMMDQAIDWLNPKKNDHLLDLFCGIGNFSLPLARYCQQVDGIEVSQQLIERARSNQRRNQIDNARFITADLTQSHYLSEIKQHYQCVVLDPPRSGAQNIMPHLWSLAPRHILYVSCNPITFARDAAQLTRAKPYRLEKVGILNMFPHTKHVETMGLFIRTS